jgi:hypothetical protein
MRIKKWLKTNRKRIRNIADIFGKFQEACQLNRNNNYLRRFWNSEYGWIDEQHCDCNICREKRIEKGLHKCVGKSCDGCKRRDEDRKLPISIKKMRGLPSF